MTNPAGLRACVRCGTLLAAPAAPPMPAAGTEVAATLAPPAPLPGSAPPAPPQPAPPAPPQRFGASPFRVPDAASRFAPGGSAQPAADSDPFGYFGGPAGGPPAGWGDTSGRPSGPVHPGLSSGRPAATQSSHALLLVLVAAALLGGIVATWWFVIRPGSGGPLAVGGTDLQVTAPAGYHKATGEELDKVNELLDTLSKVTGGEAGSLFLEKDEYNGLIAMYLAGDASAMSGADQRIEDMAAAMRNAGMPTKTSPVQHALGSGQKVTFTMSTPEGPGTVEMVLITTPSAVILAAGIAKGSEPPPEFQEFLDSFNVGSSV